MKAKTIQKVLSQKFDALLATIEDEPTRKLVAENTIITGGCIASMLLNEQVNDFDLYFTDIATTEAVAKYYINKFPVGGLMVESKDGRVRIVTPNGYRGETAGDVETLGDPADIEDRHESAEDAALKTESEGKPAYRPVFVTTNAITLSDKIQIVLRFYGEADTIHENYDFAHCTNYWTSKDRKVVLKQAALEALLAKELRYIGSKYPLCSIIRLRKFIKRGWQINAGQILKMAMQLNALDLLDPKILEDQLTGVDSAYFMQLMTRLRENDPEKVNAAYLVEIIDRMF